MNVRYGIDILRADWRRIWIRRFVTGLVGAPATTTGMLEHGAHELKDQLLYSIVRTLRPDRVVETGVWVGWSSRAILAAMHENGKGHLVSIDMPRIGPGEATPSGVPDTTYVHAASETGKEIPEYLRYRWDLRLGSSTDLLKEVIDGEPIDMFFHDSDHTVSLMRWEYETAWPSIRKGGILYSDDIDWNDAFASFATSVGRVPHTFSAVRGATGGVRK